MVSELQVKTAAAVKVEQAPAGIEATAKGELGLIEALARKTRLWSDCEKLLPARRDPTQGFAATAVAAAVARGLLAGGRGFCATEPMRRDAPLLATLGLSRAVGRDGGGGGEVLGAPRARPRGADRGGRAPMRPDDQAGTISA